MHCLCSLEWKTLVLGVERFIDATHEQIREATANQKVRAHGIDLNGGDFIRFQSDSIDKANNPFGTRRDSLGHTDCRCEGSTKYRGKCNISWCGTNVLNLNRGSKLDKSFLCVLEAGSTDDLELVTCGLQNDPVYLAKTNRKGNVNGVCACSNEQRTWANNYRRNHIEIYGNRCSAIHHRRTCVNDVTRCTIRLCGDRHDGREQCQTGHSRQHRVLHGRRVIADKVKRSIAQASVSKEKRFFDFVNQKKKSFSFFEIPAEPSKLYASSCSSSR